MPKSNHQEFFGEQAPCSERTFFSFGRSRPMTNTNATTIIIAAPDGKSTRELTLSEAHTAISHGGQSDDWVWSARENDWKRVAELPELQLGSLEESMPTPVVKSDGAPAAVFVFSPEKKSLVVKGRWLQLLQGCSLFSRLGNLRTYRCQLCSGGQACADELGADDLASDTGAFTSWLVCATRCLGDSFVG